MVRYLLGELSEEEQDRLEERFLSDDEWSEELLALENELKYDYAQGGLTPEERERFEKRFLRSQEDRDGIETAGAVLQAVSGMKRRPENSGFAWRHLRISQALGWSLAAAVLLSVSVVWLLVEIQRLRGRIGQMASSHSAEVEALQKRGADERLRVDRLRDELENARRQQAQVKERSAPAFVVLALTPGLARDPASAPKRLAMQPGTESVQVDLTLRSSAEYAGYRATLRTADGSEVWKSGNLRAAGRIVRCNLPARLLRPGDYELLLEGITPGRTFDEAGDYYFTVASSSR